jgi:hypothetical protein
MAISTRSSKRHKENDPSRLRGLGQAIYILEEICGGKERNALIRKFHGDKMLVDMWMNFLQHNHWIRYDRYSKEWVLTEKGKLWIEKIEGVLPLK